MHIIYFIYFTSYKTIDLIISNQFYCLQSLIFDLFYNVLFLMKFIIFYNFELFQKTDLKVYIYKAFINISI